MAESAAARAIRLIDLVPYLLNHPGVSLKEVAQEFGVSTTELIKDLDLLFMCGLPGYTPLELIDLSVEDGIISLREPQNLDLPRRFSQREALLLRISLSALEDILPIAKREKVKSLRKKISNLFTNEIPEGALFFESDVERNAMSVIEEAAATGKKVLISYFNPAKSQISDRKVSILRIIAESRRTLIEAWCDTNQGVRRFNLANIKAVALTSEVAAISDPSLEDEKHLQARISLSEETRFFLENQKELKRDGETFLIDIFQSEWLIRSAFAECGEIAVHAPNALREEISARSREALKNYSL